MAKLSDFTPDTKNANRGTARGQKMIVGSIQRSGFGRSVVVDRDGRIIGGNKTIEATAEVLGTEVEPIIVESDGTRPIIHKRSDLDLSDPNPNNPARQLAYADNLASYYSFELDPAVTMADIEAGFDFEALDIRLPDLGELLEGAVKDLLNNSNGQEPEVPTETEAARLARQYDVKPGQVWELGRHLIACIDSTDETAVKELIAGQKVGMVWADPPYGVEAVDKNSRMQDLGWKQYANDSDIKTAEKSFGTCYKFDCKMIYWGANHYANKLPNSPGWIIWDKQDGKDSLTYSMCELAWHNAGNNVQVFRHIWDGFRKDSERNDSRLHPSQKPVALSEWYFTKYGQPNDLIFDPFLGSGISVLAAENLNDNRRVIGCELAPEYIAVTIHRWQQLTGKEPKLLNG